MLRVLTRTSTLSRMMGSTPSSTSTASWLLDNPAGSQHYVLKTDYTVDFYTTSVPGLDSAIFGTGCFWGAEKAFWRLPGVHTTSVGFYGGTKVNPTYKEVCTGRTGHNEVVQVVWDTSKLSFEDILSVFWKNHDPTQGEGQGGDRGSQYRSGIYVKSEEHALLAEASKAALEPKLKAKGFGPITTEIFGPKSPGFDSKRYYLAEEYHQQYIAKPGNRQYCSAEPTKVPLPPISEWPGISAELKSKHAAKLPPSFYSSFDTHVGEPNSQVVWDGSKIVGGGKWKIGL